jgi:hypothetical protein
MAQPLLGFRKKTLFTVLDGNPGILTTVENTDETLDTVIDSFELPYKVDAKLSMANMATIVQEHGLVTKKKSRGKTKK